MPAESILDHYETLKQRAVSWLWVRLSAGERESAEEIADDAFMRCLRAQERGQLVSTSYFWTAVHGAMLDHLRRNAKHSADVPMLDWPEVATASKLDEWLMFYDLLDSTGDWLIERERLVAELVALGYRHEDIARALGISYQRSRDILKTIRRRARRLRDADRLAG